MRHDPARSGDETGSAQTADPRETRSGVEGLLPQKLLLPSGLEIAHHYRPAGDATRVGGDWYDVIPLMDGRVTLVMGDAMGHGTTAAAAMGQLRAAARTLARRGVPPDEMLRRLDLAAQEMAAAQFATCVAATYDPAAGRALVSRAGHVPPILVRPRGTSRVLTLPPGLPLGIGGAAFEAVEVRVPEGSTLVLYTDGLVESRERDMDTGIASLRATLARCSGPLQDACDAIVTELSRTPEEGRGEDRGEDDVALLLVRSRGRSAK
ncbi:MAG: PP2C family protein-serine/threonine phosphatase [Streptosporangiaceae bacterium]